MGSIDYGVIATKLVDAELVADYNKALELLLLTSISADDECNKSYTEDADYMACLKLICGNRDGNFNEVEIIRLLDNDKLYDVLMANNIDPGYFALSAALLLLKLTEHKLDDVQQYMDELPMDIMSDTSQNVFNGVVSYILSKFGAVYG